MMPPTHTPLPTLPYSQTPWEQVFSGIEVLTFDCYGTLIDWATGLRQAFEPIIAAHGLSLSPLHLLHAYGELESPVQQEGYQSYKGIMREVLRRLGTMYDFTPTPEELEAFPYTIGQWPVFPDTVEALGILKDHFRLIPLSNIDRDLFALTEPLLGVSMDGVITAEDVQSYKPAPGHFEAANTRIPFPPEARLHVAQSLFHDIAPALELGLNHVWVNRANNLEGEDPRSRFDIYPKAAVPDLITLARLVQQNHSLPS